MNKRRPTETKACLPVCLPTSPRGTPRSDPALNPPTSGGPELSRTCPSTRYSRMPSPSNGTSPPLLMRYWGFTASDARRDWGRGGGGGDGACLVFHGDDLQNNGEKKQTVENKVRYVALLCWCPVLNNNHPWRKWPRSWKIQFHVRITIITVIIVVISNRK